MSLISDDDALPRGGPEREALNAYQFLILIHKAAKATPVTARKLIVEYAGAIYHVMNRGDRKRHSEHHYPGMR